MGKRRGGKLTIHPLPAFVPLPKFSVFPSATLAQTQIVDGLCLLTVLQGLPKAPVLRGLLMEEKLEKVAVCVTCWRLWGSSCRFLKQAPKDLDETLAESTMRLQREVQQSSRVSTTLPVYSHSLALVPCPAL